MLEYRFEPDALVLSGELQVTFFEQLAEALRQAALNPGDLKVDVAGVTDIDTAGLQMLLAFLREYRNQAKVALAGITPAFAKALALTGLDEHYGPFLA